MNTKRYPIRFGLIFVGLLFFFNPYFAVIDVLPDFIGCLLIISGLSRAMLINRVLREARTAFFRLMLVDLVKTGLLMITMSAGATEQPTALLLLAFSASVIELFFLIPQQTEESVKFGNQTVIQIIFQHFLPFS